MKRKPPFDFEAECKFRDLPPGEVAAACFYEYARESQGLRDLLAPNSKAQKGLPRMEGFCFADYWTLAMVLQEVDFPKPWKKLTSESRAKLVKTFTEWKAARMERKPPLVIKELPLEPIISKTDPTSFDWKAVEPVLLEPPNFSLFFGTIQIDHESCNESEVVAAFKAWFGNRWAKTKGGNQKLRAEGKLTALAVMRIWKQITEPRRRVKKIAEITGLGACKDYSASLAECYAAGRFPEPISKSASVEMSSARADAQKYFLTLFPGQEPLSL